ncbi:MAG: 2,4-dihydroxyhept-2-ene-1,7-dioic acid aldolase, partial [Acetobacteraceae bacterium]|nr:2,4-dihydroxyhept-2-ene-1,7-dioic acid aldolase [Acetobacteraceae bacterium]
EGKPVLNGWLSVGNSFTAEIMASVGYDSVTADLQHGAFDYHAMLGMFQAIGSSGVAVMARVPWLEAGAIMKVLDAGAFGVICPMINSRAEAERLVSYIRYPPGGTRSFGPTRANFSAGGNYSGEADNTIICFAMIETREAYERVEEIAATPGLDGIYIGPADLTLGLTGKSHRTGFDREEPDMVDAIRHILDVAHKAGKRAALHTGTAAYAAKAVGWGFDLVTVSNDVRLLAGAAQSSVTEFRKRVAAGQAPAQPANEGA